MRVLKLTEDEAILLRELLRWADLQLEELEREDDENGIDDVSRARGLHRELVATLREQLA